MTGFIIVALGGAFGSMLRYAISLIPYRGAFPVLTLITNVCGAVLIGYIAGTAAEKHLSDNLVLFLKTGICGGFTTFSTFSLEAYNLIGQGRYGQAGVYVVLSTGLCLLGVWCGMLLARVS
ncbi:fluoride efflux transporter CrcB [Muricomes intestini]|jgi:CrcB protein|uniref:Fluoride-specific ion channel FluC n=1 Tax=Muricomes intestini TaxID=1796634 RepID=A0A4V6NYZ2_9FIRM|nr:fluoride efflux transporter CrcB [Muricomes intestini]TCS82252.1 CrcB protein [Muricomes intestini]